jgi:predicted nucleic acid-binding protein
MSGAEAFIDTSVLLYLISEDPDKADRVEALLQQPVTISVQVLNEFAVVALRKLKLSFPEIREILGTIRQLCNVLPLAAEHHDKGLEVAERYRFSLYDSIIVASALLAGCKKLYSEDLQHPQVLDQQLKVINPFVKG